jgi:MarR family transcriptional regulator, 2-MHQ and catechol-resistance regulon repressor
VRTDLNDPRFTAIGLFAEAFTGLQTRFTAQLEQFRLSGVEFEVMMRLARTPGRRLRMTELAGQTSLSTSGVTRVVDRMERDGLIRREACPTDRRSSYAVITESGLKRLDEVLPGHLELIQQRRQRGGAGRLTGRTTGRTRGCACRKRIYPGKR